MKITKGKLRRLISESIKDQEEFNEFTRQISKAYDQIKKDNPEVDDRAEMHSMPADVAQRKVTGLRRDIKRFWNEKADHGYFQDPSKFICVHYIAGNSSVTRGIESFFKSAKPKAKNNFELSTIGYASMKDVGRGGFMGRIFGFILSPRRVTYAAHSDIGSENVDITGFSAAGKAQRKQMEKEIISKLPVDVQNDPENYKIVRNLLRQKLFGSSGSAKRPMLSGRAPVFDEEDVKRALKVPGGILESTDIIAEVICDNWTPSTFILPSRSCDELYLDWDNLTKYGLKYYVYDTGEYFENKESMPEKYKQAAAKRLQRRKENEEYLANITKKKAEAEKAAQEKEDELEKAQQDILANNPDAESVEFIGDDPNDYVLILEKLLSKAR